MSVMKSRVQSAIKDFLLKAKAMDEAIPEELAEDALEMAEEVKDALCSDEEVDVLEITRDKKGKDEEEIEAKVEDAVSRVLLKYGVVKDKSTSALDELEAKLKGEVEDGSCEENVLDEDGDEDKKDAKDSALEIIRQFKRDIAKVKDASIRKRLSDSMARTLKMQTTADYGAVFAASTKSAKDGMVNSSMKKSVADADYDFGMDIAKRFNPNYKEGK